MKRMVGVGMIAMMLGTAVPCLAQPVAGKSLLGVEVTELQAVMSGWSVKKSLLRKPVYNDQNQKIGIIDDIIVTPENQASYAIIGVGGFLKVGEHKVPIPMGQLKIEGKKITLPGATREQLKQIPKFEYNK